ncbi:MAG TPA: hypothetical protein VFQ35_12565 [Polyangiaceae bacterium]|nr:hypothetical protein [Polyangiaceae bacterium]
MKRGLAAAWLALTCFGCASTRAFSGKPPGRTARDYDARWHSALLFGGVSLSRPYDLAQICRHGWSEVRVEPDTFTFAVTLATLFIYTPSRVTVVCAAPSGAGRPKLHSYPPPGIERDTLRMP